MLISAVMLFAPLRLCTNYLMDSMTLIRMCTPLLSDCHIMFVHRSLVTVKLLLKLRLAPQYIVFFLTDFDYSNNSPDVVLLAINWLPVM